MEGLSGGGEYHLLQKAFVDSGAIQCGYCTPGMLMSAYALISKKGRVSPEEAREAISGNFCRCTGYTQIVQAIVEAAELINKKKEQA